MSAIVKFPNKRVVLTIVCDLYEGSDKKDWNMHAFAANLIGMDGFPLPQPMQIAPPPPEYTAGLLNEFARAFNNDVAKSAKQPESLKAQENIPLVASIDA